MGDKPKEKLPTKVFGSGSLPSAHGAEGNPSSVGEESPEDYTAVRRGTLPPPAPPKSDNSTKPVRPKRPEAPPRPSRMAERVAQALALGLGEEGDERVTEAVRPSLSEEERNDVARLSGIILGIENSLENALEGPADSDDAEESIVVESIRDLDGTEEGEPTQVIETGEPETVILPEPVEPELPEPKADEKDSWGSSDNFSPDEIPTLPPPETLEAKEDPPTVKMRISVQRAVRIREQFLDSKAEDGGAPFLIKLDDYGMIRCPLVDGDTIVIGRSPASDIVVDESEESVSANHAMIKREGDDCFIRDCESTNGTFVNGMQILSDAWFELLHADKLFLGNDKLSIFFSDSKKPKRASAQGGNSNMTENDMKAPTVEVPSTASSDADKVQDANDDGEENTSPEIVSEEPIVPKTEEEPEPEKKIDDDKAVRHLAPTVPLEELDLPEAKPEPDKTKPPEGSPSPPPLPTNEKASEKTSLALKVGAVVAAVIFIIIIYAIILIKVGGNIFGQEEAVVADIEKATVAVTDHKPVSVLSAIEAGTIELTAVDVLTRMEPIVQGKLGWTPIDPEGPLADIVMGQRMPMSSGDCFPEVSPTPPELDALRCCLVLGNNGDVEEIAKCVGMSMVTQLRQSGGLPSPS